MARPKAPKETDEQRQQRQIAEAENVRSIQTNLRSRTSMFNRIRSPRVSIATGRSVPGYSLAR